ncbi:MAG: 1-acyl-sn-glycerol-3-phosphate acyltransferase [Candidatus Obscuribacterales bacterium]|nr:1-acyl-sn-glycerol-3-phosphate acyltransferase [Candidatus Obscuribacterales bacterium]
MTNVLITLGVAAAAFALWYLRWSFHAKRYTESGYVPARPGLAGKWFFGFGAWLLTTLGVGRVKVKRTAKLPHKMDHVLWAANHQFPTDFAMLRRGVGRHFRMLTDSAQLTGFFGVLSAFCGVVSVRFKDKAKDGPAAAEACTKVVAEKRGFVNRLVTVGVAAATALSVIVALGDGGAYAWYAALFFGWAAATMTWGVGQGGSLGIFPQGALIPENEMPAYDGNFHYGSFRPGAIKMARDAAAATGEPVYIVPVGIYYNRDKKKADWTLRHFAGIRKALNFKGLRNPKAWEPCFKDFKDVDLSTLPAEKRAEVEAAQAAAMDAYKKSTVILGGGAVVVGEALEISTLNSDPMLATEEVRARIADLTLQAEKLFNGRR